MSRKRNFRNSGGSRTFPNGFSFSNVYPQEPRFPPLHVGAVSARTTLQDSAKHQSPQTQLNSEDHETILSKDQELDIESTLDFNDIFEQGKFCSDAGFDDSSDKSIIFLPPNKSSSNVKDGLSKNIEF